MVLAVRRIESLSAVILDNSASVTTSEPPLSVPTSIVEPSDEMISMRLVTLMLPNKSKSAVSIISASSAAAVLVSVVPAATVNRPVALRSRSTMNVTASASVISLLMVIPLLARNSRPIAPTAVFIPPAALNVILPMPVAAGPEVTVLVLSVKVSAPLPALRTRSPLLLSPPETPTVPASTRMPALSDNTVNAVSNRTCSVP